MRRWAILPAGLLAALAFWFWTGTQPPLGAPRASADDCVDVQIWSNGWHASFGLEAARLPPAHPLRRLYPGARHFLVGWGDADFYRSDGTDLARGLKALLPGGATTVHVIAAASPVADTFIPAQLAAVGLSHAGAAQLAEALADSLARDAAGDAIPIAPGQHGGGSRFLAGRGEFNLFNVCNQWAARVLRQAGVGVNAAWVYRGDWLVAQVERAAPSCTRVRAGAVRKTSRRDMLPESLHIAGT